MAQEFTRRFDGGVHSLRLELPVPKAQHNSRGANMISTLKYSLLKQVLLMGFAPLVVDLDLVFLKDPVWNTAQLSRLFPTRCGAQPHLPPSSLAQLCRYYPATPPQFHHLYRDADVEASTDGFTSGWASGSIGSVHEPKMGWGAGGLYIQV